MPFDGIMVNCIARELDKVLQGSRIERVYQPEKDEIGMQIRTRTGRFRLIASANTAFPRIHLSTDHKKNPDNAPMFCMFLRKHVGGGFINRVTCDNFERIVTIHTQNTDEMGDTVEKKLIIEIMGKHSNIILTNQDDVILDAIKHVDQEINRVREIMPARPYILPPPQDKITIDRFDVEEFNNLQTEQPTDKVILSYIKGFSPVLCNEICYRADVEPRLPFDKASTDEKIRLSEQIKKIKTTVTTKSYDFCIAYSADPIPVPIDFHCIDLSRYSSVKKFETANEMLDHFYVNKDKSERLVQRKSHLKKIIKNNMDRCEKKIAIYDEQLRDTADRDKLKLYGELLTANIYALKQGMNVASVSNYYSENMDIVEIPMDQNKSVQQNAQSYYKRYSKAKTKYEYSIKMIEETKSELEYLESVNQLLDDSVDDEIIDEIKKELELNNYLKQTGRNKKSKDSTASKPYRYYSSDGLRIYVGKNNIQNDNLTLKTAQSNDIWLHTQKIPGSHVIIKKDYDEIPESTIYEAAILAAWHSKAKNSSNVPVDYTKVRNVKKPKNAKPGMVIYEDFKTLRVTPDTVFIDEIKQNTAKREI